MGPCKLQTPYSVTSRHSGAVQGTCTCCEQLKAAVHGAGKSNNYPFSCPDLNLNGSRSIVVRPLAPLLPWKS